MIEEIKIKSETIKLDQFLKWANIVSTGGEAKFIIQAGKVKVDGEIEYKRGKQLSKEDVVELIELNKSYKISRG